MAVITSQGDINKIVLPIKFYIFAFFKSGTRMLGRTDRKMDGVKYAIIWQKNYKSLQAI